jgi:hypothetical protein
VDQFQTGRWISFRAAEAMNADGTFGNEAPQPLFFPWSNSFAQLKVVAIRLDPCFGETNPKGVQNCTNTIRLVLQFFKTFANEVKPDGRAAIHLFYTISRSEFVSLAKEMLKLRRQAKLPIQKGFISPTMGAGNADAFFGVNPTLASDVLKTRETEGVRNSVFGRSGGLSHSARDVAAWQ